MKQVLIIAAIIFSSVVNGQTSKDTTSKLKIVAPKYEPKDTTYVLGGNIPDFQLLYKAVTSPNDVTPNEMKALAAWIQKVQMIEVPKKPKQ